MKLLLLFTFGTFLNFTAWAQIAFTLEETKDLSNIVGLPYNPVPSDFASPSRFFSYQSSYDTSIVESGTIVVDLIKKQLAVALPGTMNEPDCVVDIDYPFKKIGWMKGNAHEGFLKECENIIIGLDKAFVEISNDIGADLNEFFYNYFRAQ